MKATLLMSALLIPLAAMSQTTSESSFTVKIIESQDSVPLYAIMHENAPHQLHIPDVPRFALLGKEGKFYMGIGANIKAVALYDFGNPVSDPNCFTVSGIPMTREPGNGGKFNFSAQQSNIYLNVVAMPGTKNQLGAYVSINFLGDGYTPKLQHAYLKYRGFIAGYTHSIFTDVGATPATIDYEGPDACTSIMHGMIAYERNFGKDRMWRAGIAADIPEYSVTNATNTAKVTQRVPDIPFYIQRSWAGGDGWLRLSGMIRNLYYRDLAAQKNVDKIGWGIKASGKTPIAGGLSAYYQAVYGKGISSYIQDLNGLGMDMMPDPSNPSRLDLVKAWGAYGTLRYDFSPTVYTSATYSHVRTYADQYADSSIPWKNGYRYGQYIVANVFWQVNSIVQVGAEYLYGKRVDFDGQKAHDNRFEAMLQVSF